jgi:SAM-dependent methyltransferase
MKIRLIDIPTGETLAFATEVLGAGRRRLLEIGCGTGELALALAGLGHEVTALDADAEAVRAACARGVDARHVEWPSFEDRPCDAILFTRSLHHLHALSAALDRAHDLLRPGGLVLVEDFAFSEITARTRAWFAELLRVLQKSDSWRPTAGSFALEVLEARGSPDPWRSRHDLHTATAMHEGLAARFALTAVAAAPYLYRYLVPVLAESDVSCELLAGVLAQEKTLIERHAIDAVGRRFVGRRR